MTGTRLADLRAELSAVVDRIERALAAGEDTTALEDHANDLQDQIDAILEVGGAEEYEAVRRRERPQAEPPPPSDRLF
ncbi:hypothetical protein ACFYTS_35535 [Nocardia sp. NPDC004151]|uniref:hypothetical protein n=1 Tax=Nocardia sp. NPDC004151 TaxID=3364304 RepID=UPI00368904EB